MASIKEVDIPGLSISISRAVMKEPPQPGEEPSGDMVRVTNVMVSGSTVTADGTAVRSLPITDIYRRLTPAQQRAIDGIIDAAKGIMLADAEIPESDVPKHDAREMNVHPRRNSDGE